MAYRYKIYPHTTHDGIESWLEWNGDALVAHAVKVSDDRMVQANATRIVGSVEALRLFLPKHDRPYTTPEKLARDQAIEAVRETLEQHQAIMNGGW